MELRIKWGSHFMFNDHVVHEFKLFHGIINVKFCNLDTIILGELGCLSSFALLFIYQAFYFVCANYLVLPLIALPQLSLQFFFNDNII